MAARARELTASVISFAVFFMASLFVAAKLIITVFYEIFIKSHKS